MYGTIAHLKMKPGKWDDLVRLVSEWDVQQAPKAAGVRAGYLVKLDEDPSTAIMVAVFDDAASYRTNAERPEQHEWYLELRALLEADPIWEDGEFIKFS